MKRHLLSISLFVSLNAFAADPKPKETKPGFVLGGNPANGQVTFKTYCNSCHGDTGAGDGPASAALNPKPANFTDAKHAAEVTDEYIYKMVKDGGAANGKSPLMVGWGPVLGDDAKVRDVAAYVRTLAKPAAAPKKPSKK